MLKQTYMIAASIDNVWDALVNPETIERWGGGPATMDLVNQGEFTYWGGDIYGINTKVVVNKRLEQDWYGGEWDRPSKVVITLSYKKGKVKVDLKHFDLPKKEENSFAKGWKDDFFEPLKELAEKKE